MGDVQATSFAGDGAALSNVTASSVACVGCVGASIIDTSEVQSRVSGTCASGSSIRIIDDTGAVTCETDDLDNHTATQNLDLSTFKLVGNGGSVGISVANDGSVTIGNTITIDGVNDTITASSGTISFDDENLTTTGTVSMSGFALSTGASDGEVLTSDGLGTGIWQALPASPNLWETISGDTGSTAANAQTDTLNVVGSGTVATAIVGDTLTIIGSSSADDLGSHTATQNLDLATFKLVGNGGSAGVTVNSTGDVGIGLNNPEAKLHVENTGTGLTLRLDDATNDLTPFAVDNAGNVGIGKTNPTEKLDVVGNIHATGTIKSGNSITIDGATDSITATTGTISFDNENLTTTGTVTIGSFTMATGASAGLALTSDGAGIGTWQALPNLFATFTGDSGTTTADAQTDTLNILGSGTVSTAMVVPERKRTSV